MFELCMQRFVFELVLDCIGQANPLLICNLRLGFVNGTMTSLGFLRNHFFKKIERSAHRPYEIFDLYDHDSKLFKK